MEIRIYYEDTDCGGVVYYANYLKYFERARTHYLEECGVSVSELLQDGTQFMVVRAHVDYRTPAHYGDTLSIDTRLSERSKATLCFAHVIRERRSGRVIVEGSATLAAVNVDGKIKRLPQGLLDLPAAPPSRRVRRLGQGSKKGR
ncbi:MAG: acyl-CoA thioesterase [Nitrospiraceae bacterium]